VDLGGLVTTSDGPPHGMLAPMEAAAFALTVAALAVSLVTLGVAVGIYRAQRRMDEDWQNSDRTWKGGKDEQIATIYAIVAELQQRPSAAAAAKAEDDQITADPSPEPGDDGAAAPGQEHQPPDVDGYVEALRRRLPQGALDWGHLIWEKKVRPDGARGNFGWYVHDRSGLHRYLIHRGHGEPSIKEAIPPDYLHAWQETSACRPEDVRLSYQTAQGKGNHSWYVQTYDGREWRIAKGGRGKTKPTVIALDNTDG